MDVVERQERRWEKQVARILEIFEGSTKIGLWTLWGQQGSYLGRVVHSKETE